MNLIYQLAFSARPQEPEPAPVKQLPAFTAENLKEAVVKQARCCSNHLYYAGIELGKKDKPAIEMTSEKSFSFKGEMAGSINSGYRLILDEVKVHATLNEDMSMSVVIHYGATGLSFIGTQDKPLVQSFKIPALKEERNVHTPLVERQVMALENGINEQVSKIFSMNVIGLGLRFLAEPIEQQNDDRGRPQLKGSTGLRSFQLTSMITPAGESEVVLTSNRHKTADQSLSVDGPTIRYLGLNQESKKAQVEIISNDQKNRFAGEVPWGGIGFNVACACGLRDGLDDGHLKYLREVYEKYVSNDPLFQILRGQLGLSHELALQKAADMHVRSFNFRSLAELLQDGAEGSDVPPFKVAQSNANYTALEPLESSFQTRQPIPSTESEARRTYRCYESTVTVYPVLTPKNGTGLFGLELTTEVGLSENDQGQLDSARFLRQEIVAIDLRANSISPTYFDTRERILQEQLREQITAATEKAKSWGFLIAGLQLLKKDVNVDLNIAVTYPNEAYDTSHQQLGVELQTPGSENKKIVFYINRKNPEKPTLDIAATNEVGSYTAAIPLDAAIISLKSLAQGDNLPAENPLGITINSALSTIGVKFNPPVRSTVGTIN